MRQTSFKLRKFEANTSILRYLSLQYLVQISFISSTGKRSVVIFFVALDSGLSKQKYVKRNKENVYMENESFTGPVHRF